MGIGVVGLAGFSVICGGGITIRLSGEALAIDTGSFSL
jgi:hypothetical protein